jgi:plasmid segregation protein ParM
MSSKNPPTLVAHSIDVGLGLVKHTVLETHTDVPSRIAFEAFPALAIPADPSALRSVVRPRDTFDVPVPMPDGNISLFEVGPEIRRAQTGTEFGRILTTDYYTSQIYEALMLGALRRTGSSVIDILVVGLPVSQYLVPESRDALSRRWTSSAEGHDVGDGLRVVVRDVIVRPQPLGGYFDSWQHLELFREAIARSPAAEVLPRIESAEQVSELNVLVVDPGELTLDWLVMNKGQINERASGAAVDAGRFRVVRAVAEALSNDVGRKLATMNYPDIDHALRTTNKIKIEGKIYDLARYKGIISAHVLDPVNQMVQGVRGMADTLDVIVMVGGHPELYRDALTLKYPHLPIVTLPDPVFANVRGYQSVGEFVAADQAQQRAQQAA